MSPRATRITAWSAFALATVLLAGGVVLDALTPIASSGGGWTGGGQVLGDALFSLTLFAFPAVGLLLATRRPGNAIGWLLLAIGVAWGIANTPYADYGLLQHPGSLPAASVVAAITSAFWVPPIGLSGTFLILLFPDGALLTRRWRWLAWLSAFAIVVGTLALMLAPGELTSGGFPHTRNPLGAPAPFAELVRISRVAILLVPVAMALSAVSLVLRYRRAQGVERRQITWLAAAAGFVALTYLIVEPISALLPNGHTPSLLLIGQDIALGSFGLVPIAIGFAVLRYRLYEIDRIVSRTLSYAILTGLLAAIYLAIVTLTTRALPISSPVAVAAATLAAAALFNPLRRRIQHLVDRRFNRARYDADATVALFTSHLRDAIDLDSVEASLIDAVESTVAPNHASLWIRAS